MSTVAITTPHGIIPACAGNRPRYSSCGCHSGDHPRVCGEQKTLHLCNVLITGSSPRVRGTARAMPHRPIVSGIIPACAGNSGMRRGEVCGLRDHPRVCGEQVFSLAVTTDIPGSSPRVRGTVICTVVVLSCTGIIPACAGNRFFL